MSYLDMTGGNGSCSTDSWKMWQEQVWKISMPILCSIEFPFAYYFTRQLMESTKDRGGLADKRNRLAVAVLCYIFSVTMTFLLISWQEIVSPIMQKLRNGRYEIEGCAISTFFSITFATLSYLCLVEILVLRLNHAFKSTMYQVKKDILHLFHGSVAMALFVGLLGYILRAAYTTCKRIRFTGYLHTIGIANKRYKYCAVPKDTEWLAGAVVVLGLIYVFCADIILGWMFISRLHQLAETDSGSVTATNAFGTVIEKSSVIALSSIFTTVTALIAAAFSGLNLVFEIDLLLNMLFLYTMFSFGTDLYQRIFGPFVGWIRHRYGQDIRSNQRRLNSDPKKNSYLNVGSASPGINMSKSPSEIPYPVQLGTAMTDLDPNAVTHRHSPTGDGDRSMSLSGSNSCDIDSTDQAEHKETKKKKKSKKTLPGMVSVNSQSDVTIDRKTFSSGGDGSPPLEIIDDDANFEE